MVLVLGIVKASLEILGIGIGVKKVVLLMSAQQPQQAAAFRAGDDLSDIFELTRPFSHQSRVRDISFE